MSIGREEKLRMHIYGLQTTLYACVHLSIAKRRACLWACVCVCVCVRWRRVWPGTRECMATRDAITMPKGKHNPNTACPKLPCPLVTKPLRKHNPKTIVPQSDRTHGVFPHVAPSAVELDALISDFVLQVLRCVIWYGASPCCVGRMGNA